MPLKNKALRNSQMLIEVTDPSEVENLVIKCSEFCNTFKLELSLWRVRDIVFETSQVVDAFPREPVYNENKP